MSVGSVYGSSKSSIFSAPNVSALFLVNGLTGLFTEVCF